MKGMLVLLIAVTMGLVQCSKESLSNTPVITASQKNSGENYPTWVFSFKFPASLAKTQLYHLEWDVKYPGENLHYQWEVTIPKGTSQYEEQTWVPVLKETHDIAWIHVYP